MKLSSALILLLTSASVAAESPVEPNVPIDILIVDPCSGAICDPATPVCVPDDAAPLGFTCVAALEEAIAVSVDPCFGAICDSATPNCVADDTTTLGFTCVADEVPIPPDFGGGCSGNVLCTLEEPVCQEVGGVVSCVNPCATVRCGKEKPVCIVQDNAASCVISPCATVRCGFGTTCQYDLFGQPTCAPDASSNPTCLTAKCSKEKPYCDDSSGLPICTNPCDDKNCRRDEVCELENVVCVKAPCPPIAKCVSIRPWFDAIKDTYVGDEPLKKCGKRVTPPTEGKKCSSRPKACFFGTQDCKAGFEYPETKCVCKDHAWSCESALPCPASFP